MRELQTRVHDTAYVTEAKRLWSSSQAAARWERRVVTKIQASHIHTCPPPVAILSHIGLIHNPTSHYLKIHLNIIIPLTPWSSKFSLSPRFPTKTLYNLLSCPQYALHDTPPHCRFYRPNSIGWLQIIKLLITWFSPLPCNLVRLTPRYSPQHPILKHPQPTFLPKCKRPSYTPIQNNRQNHKSIYLDLYIFG